MSQVKESKFSYGGKNLGTLSHDELLEAVEAIWQAKNEEIARHKAEAEGLRALLKSPLPIHTLWRGFAENATLLMFVAFAAYSMGAN